MEIKIKYKNIQAAFFFFFSVELLLDHVSLLGTKAILFFFS